MKNIILLLAFSRVKAFIDLRRERDVKDKKYETS